MVRYLSLLLFIGLAFWSCEDRPRSNPLDLDNELDPSEWAPSNLQVQVIDDSQIKLTWIQEDDRISGFRISRKAGSGSFAQIAQVGKAVTEYTDTGLTLGTTYTYLVKAFTDANESDYIETIVYFWQDCLGEWGGTAVENECGCVEGNTGLTQDFCYGCTDPYSAEYDPNATIEDGSCHGIEWVALPGGTFTMGDIWNAGDSDELPTHQVTLSSFEISTTEITNQQYADYLTAALPDGSITATSSSVTGTWEGSSYEFLDLDNSNCQISYSSGQFNVDSGKENYPVIEVTWYGATGFAEHYGIRLPTEAEWEYAARGIASGEDHKWSGTFIEVLLINYAWYSTNNSPSGTKEVATKLPNGSGLYDMSGNVWEWVSDWHGSYSSGSQTNPQGPESGIYRVLRGGGWGSYGTFCRVANRNWGNPDGRLNDCGFRLVRSQDS